MAFLFHTLLNNDTWVKRSNASPFYSTNRVAFWRSTHAALEHAASTNSQRINQYAAGESVIGIDPDLEAATLTYVPTYCQDASFYRVQGKKKK